eukprot:gene4076-14171_t
MSFSVDSPPTSAQGAQTPLAPHSSTSSSSNSVPNQEHSGGALREVHPHLVPPVPPQRTWMEWLTCKDNPDVMPTNEIRTSKYTVLNFLPVNLFMQFTRVANLYFLIISALQFIPQLSPTSWFTTVMPLVFVLAINAVKEGIGGGTTRYKRHMEKDRSDTEVNARLVEVLRAGKGEVATAWRDVVVGDIVKVLDGAEVPADMVFLCSSVAENICYVETANLDGETDLKVKFCYVGTSGKKEAAEFEQFCSSGKKEAAEFEQFCSSRVIHCEAPNPNLYSFDGSITYSGDPSKYSEEAADQQGDVVDPIEVHLAHVASQRQNPIHVENLLLRGCTIRKTEWLIGVVVFTGQDSKIMMNRLESPRKVTQLERHMNVLVLIIAAILFFFACMLSAGNNIWMNLNSGQWYLQLQDKYPDFGPGFPGWAIGTIRYIILLNGMIPISLYVTLEETDTPFACHTTNLNEDLGQVEYVLSDKTGTLTQNIMGFVCMSVGGTFYRAGLTRESVSTTSSHQHPMHVPKDTPHTIVLDTKLQDKLGDHFQHVPKDTPHTFVLDTKLQDKLGDHFQELAFGEIIQTVISSSGASSGARQGNSGVGRQRKAATEADPDVFRFCICLAVCNTVQPSVHEDGSVVYQPSVHEDGSVVYQPSVLEDGSVVYQPSVLEDGSVVYQSSSPDEEALVQGAAYLGFKLINRSSNKVQVSYYGQTWEYDILAVLEFNADRKRMSVLCRCPDGQIRLFCKGADTMVMARIKDGPLVRGVRQHLETMAVEGFRTLCFTDKVLSDVQADQWLGVYTAAQANLADRERAVGAASSLLEIEMDLIGCSAVEDKLQIDMDLIGFGAVEDKLQIDKDLIGCSAVENKLQIDMDLIGCSAVEDKIQDGVPEAIQSILDADIKLWVLTGDKVETAINIALSCRLFSSDMSLVEIRDRDFEGPSMDVGEILENKCDEVRNEYESHLAMLEAEGGVLSAISNVGLVVEGGALALLIGDAALRSKFVRLCTACKSVVFCRTSPLQKAMMTQLVKKEMGAITLAIGDGANDVSMIKAAHIGCGISGREGRAAVLAADFSMAQFSISAREGMYSISAREGMYSISAREGMYSISAREGMYSISAREGMYSISAREGMYSISAREGMYSISAREGM